MRPFSHLALIAALAPACVALPAAPSLTLTAARFEPSASRGTPATRVARAAVNGCADGTREGFRDAKVFPDVAGCSGAWSVPGVIDAPAGEAPACPGLGASASTLHPACGRRAGNTGALPRGQGCNVSDLCAAGWHVCATADDVARHAPRGCDGATRPGDPPLFFAARQSSNGCVRCALGDRAGADCDAAACTEGCAQTPRLSNDVFGCGNFGDAVGTCAALDRFGNNLCGAFAGSSWSCDAPGAADDNGLCEAYTVAKSGPDHGGVLCCRDFR
ncbi:MAG: hypothetical protein U0324_36665 [Polyangiales bacterium]